MWVQFKTKKRLWETIITYGLDRPERQRKLTKVAFPDNNWAEVDAALRAGNKLKTLYDLSCGRSAIARDATGEYKTGSWGLKVEHVSTKKDTTRLSLAKQ